MQRLASLLHWTLGCETQAELTSARHVLAGYPERFTWSGNDLEGQRISQLLSRARQQFEEVCSLDMVAPTDTSIEPETSADLPQAAA